MRSPAGKLTISKKYVLLGSENFVHCIDALNHFLDATYRATMARLVLDERDEALMKTISFSALSTELREFVRKLEGDCGWASRSWRSGPRSKDTSELAMCFRSAWRRSVIRRHDALSLDAGQADAWRAARLSDGLGQADVPVAALAVRAETVS